MDKYIDFNGFKKLCERIVNKTAKKASLDEHIGNKSNPHGVTKSQVGLGNVPNVATNNQTPTYTTVETLAKLVTGEKLGVAFGKIAKAVDELITHLADNVKHVTAEERTAWNGKAAGNHTHSAASQSAAGYMSAEDKKKLDGVAAGANSYTHPSTSGNKHIPSGGASGQILRWSADGTAVWGADNNTTYSAMTGASASAAGTAGLVPAPAKGAQAKYLRGDGTWQTPPDTNTTYSEASQSAAGLMSADDKKKLDGVAASANNYSLPAATSAVRGGAKIGYTANGKNYPVQLSNEQMFVNVPWTDTNTTYSAMTGASASAAGTAGLVPAPAKGNQAKYLRGDGTWQTPPDTNTTYSEASQSAAGLMSADDKKKLDGVATGANKYTHPTTAGNKHIPSGGSSGQVLIWSADGTAVWGDAPSNAKVPVYYDLVDIASGVTTNDTNRTLSLTTGGQTATTITKTLKPLPITKWLSIGLYYLHFTVSASSSTTISVKIKKGTTVVWSTTKSGSFAVDISNLSGTCSMELSLTTAGGTLVLTNPYLSGDSNA